MTGVLHGFVVILVIIAAGYLAARGGVIKSNERLVLNRVAFYVATPMLLLDVLSKSDLAVVFSPVILIVTIGAVLSAAVFVVVSRIRLPRDLATTTLGAATSAYVNSNNLGLPVAVYILGDAAYVGPLMLVQVLVFTPLILVFLESTRGYQRGAFLAIGRAVANPIILASILGLVLAILHVEIPDVVHEPISMIGAAAVPLMLMSFGASLRGQRALQAGTERGLVLLSVAIKTLLMPLFTYLVCLLVGFGPQEAFVATTIAALPAAQNIYNFAASYQKAEIMVRDAVFISTFASLPVIALVALLLHP